MADVAKWQADLVLDAALDYIATSTIQVIINDGGPPASYAEATATYDLATEVMTSGDFSKDDGSPSGRELNIAAQTAITVDHSGHATGVFLGITVGTLRVFMTTCTHQDLVAANTVTIPAWIITFLDVTA